MWVGGNHSAAASWAPQQQGNDPDDSDDVLGSLLAALAEIFIIIAVGYLSVRFHVVPAAYGTALGYFAANYSMPALIFQNIATLDLATASMGLILAMLVAKVSVGGIIALLTLYLTPSMEPGESNTRGWSLAALFAMLVTSQNDFALGMPILEAIYGAAEDRAEADPDMESGTRMRDYLFLFAPIVMLVTNPICLAMLELAAAVRRRRRGSVTALSGDVNCVFICKQVLLPTALNPVVFSVAVGVVVNLVKLRLPDFVDGTLATVGSSYGPLALFTLGMSMSDKHGDEAEGKEDEDRDGKTDEKGDGGPWVQALLIVAAKSLLLPFVARFLALAITRDEDLSKFAFIYATFPPSIYTYLVAMRFRLSAGDLRRIALPTLVGTIVAAPIMFAAAEMILIDGKFPVPADPGPGPDPDPDPGSQQIQVLQLAQQVGWVSLFGALWVLSITFSMLISCRAPPHPQKQQLHPTAAAVAVVTPWRRQHLVWSVFFLAATQASYLLMAVICSPQSFRDTYGPDRARQCTLGVEGLSMASRLWGVIIVVSDIHRVYRGADPSASGHHRCFWRVVKCTKHGILWLAWVLPSVWVGALSASGLWTRLGLSCWGCVTFEFVPINGNDELLKPVLTKAARQYNIASSMLAVAMASVVIAALLWEHGKRNEARLVARQQRWASRHDSPRAARDVSPSPGGKRPEATRRGSLQAPLLPTPSSPTTATADVVGGSGNASVIPARANQSDQVDASSGWGAAAAVGGSYDSLVSDSNDADAMVISADSSSRRSSSSDNDAAIHIGIDGDGSGSGSGMPAAELAAPIWSSVALRMVGLCNAIGLLLQVGVGVGALIPQAGLNEAEGGGFMLEIAALNHFGLFAQGIGTGLLLGGLRVAPLVQLVCWLAESCCNLYRRCIDFYVPDDIEPTPELILERRVVPDDR